MIRIGVVGLLHESNTFVAQPTTLAQFEQSLLLEGESVERAFSESHHELGGFFASLAACEAAVAVPIFAARAMPSGVIDAETFETLVSRMLQAVAQAGPLDGILAAPHGATVSAEAADADGAWLSRLRQSVGRTPIVATLDAHANLSPQMVKQCNAIVAYRTNPHLDQRERGREAANLLIDHLLESRPLATAAVTPPLAINIERQCTDEPQFRPLQEVAKRQRDEAAVRSNSVLLGFPYADVEEMGSAVLAVADDFATAASAARELARTMWDSRDQFDARLISIDEAFQQIDPQGRACLLDMGDNVGGGSPGDGTELLEAMIARKTADGFVCLCDPEAVRACRVAGVDATLQLPVGGKADSAHGSPQTLEVRVQSLPDGRFEESSPRHGGITRFNQGDAAVVETSWGLTILLNSLRTAPFSLNQIRSCGLDPTAFRVLVAKGVNAPIAAYREVCSQFIRVNTRGSTSADMKQMTYSHRRKPLFPFEDEASWDAATAEVIYGFDAES